MTQALDPENIRSVLKIKQALTDIDACSQTLNRCQECPCEPDVRPCTADVQQTSGVSAEWHACMRRMMTSRGWMAAMTSVAATPAITPRSAGVGDSPGFMCRYQDSPVSYDAKPRPFDTALLICACDRELVLLAQRRCLLAGNQEQI